MKVLIYMRVNSITARIKKHIYNQSNLIGYRPSGSDGITKTKNMIKSFLEEHKIPYSIEKFPMRNLNLIRNEIIIFNEKIFCLPYVGCPPFYPYEQNYRLESKNIALKEVQNSSLIKQILDIQRTGCEGIIFISKRNDDKTLLNLITPIDNEDISNIGLIRLMPIVVVSKTSGEKIKRIMCGETSIKINITNILEYCTGENIVVTIGEGEKLVHIATHMDSPFERRDIVGANDNASGTAMLMEISKYLYSKKGIDGSKTKLIFYDAEEYNLYGCLSLLIDLNRFFESNNYKDIIDKNINFRLFSFPIPDSLIEIDTIGTGREIVYSTNDVQKAYDGISELFKDFSELKKIKITNSGGNIDYMATVLGVESSKMSHFLTFGKVNDIIHTYRDTIDTVDFDAIELYYRIITRLIDTI